MKKIKQEKHKNEEKDAIVENLLQSERKSPIASSSNSVYPWQEDDNYPSLGDDLENGAKFISGKSIDKESLKTIKLVTKETVIEALRKVYDPEIPVSLYDLGLIYSIEIDVTGDINISMTLTTPNCPVAGTLPQMVADQVAFCEGTGKIEVVLTWDPPWETSLMSEDAKLAMGLFD